MIIVIVSCKYLNIDNINTMITSSSSIIFLVLLLLNTVLVRSSSGYLYFNVYNDNTCDANVIYQYGYITDQCIIQFNTTTGQPFGSF